MDDVAPAGADVCVGARIDACDVGFDVWCAAIGRAGERVGWECEVDEVEHGDYAGTVFLSVLYVCGDCGWIDYVCVFAAVAVFADVDVFDWVHVGVSCFVYVGDVDAEATGCEVVRADIFVGRYFDCELGAGAGVAGGDDGFDVFAVGAFACDAGAGGVHWRRGGSLGRPQMDLYNI